MEKGNDNGIVFYYTYKEFKDNYNKNLNKWLELYSDATENDFKEEYLSEYESFYKIDERTKQVLFNTPNLIEEYQRKFYDDFTGLCIALNEYFARLGSRTKELLEQKLDDLEIHLQTTSLYGGKKAKYSLEELSRYLHYIHLCESGICKYKPDASCHLSVIKEKNLDYRFYRKIRPFFSINDELAVECDMKRYKNFQYSVVRIVEFLLERTEQEPLKESAELSQLKNNITFNLRPTELVELVKALAESGKVKGKMKDLYSYFGNAFNVDIKTPDKFLQDIKNRNNDSQTLFLDNLKTSLLDYMIEKDEKNKYY